MNKIIHIAIDANEANVTQRVGSNVYAFEVIKHLEQLTRDSVEIRWTVLLSTPKIPELPKERKGWQYSIIGPKPFWTQWALPLHLYTKKSDYNLLYTPGHYAPRFSPIPYVSSVMDLAFLRYPTYFKKEDLVKLKNWTAYSVKNAKKVIAISKYTKDEIIHFYKKEKNDIVIAHPAVYPPHKRPSAQTIHSVTKKFGIYGPYILFVGTIQPRKNIENLVAAFELLLKKRMISFKPHLVFAGKVGWLAEPIIHKIQSSTVHKYIHTTGFISEREKDALIAGADALTLLGLYEGFGIPALEALHFGTLPVVSSTTSLPEVVGRAGITVDPTDTKKIAGALKEALTIKVSQKARYKKEAREQITQFSWKKSAQSILDTLTSVANEN